MKKPKFASFGTVSRATMRAEDLIPCFADELKCYKGARKQYAKLLKECKAYNHETIDRETEDFILEDLFNALQTYAPDYGYFGASEGDGSDYGFWLSYDFPNDFEGRKVADLSELPKGYSGEVALINDHGNITLYNCVRGRLYEIWAVV
jgi:hypothetical protein